MLPNCCRTVQHDASQIRTIGSAQLLDEFIWRHLRHETLPGHQSRLAPPPPNPPPPPKPPNPPNPPPPPPPPPQPPPPQPPQVPPPHPPPIAKGMNRHPGPQPRRRR